MNFSEVKKSQKAFKPIAERTEIYSCGDSGGWCLSVTYHDGGSKIYYNYDDVLTKLQMQFKTFYVVRSGWNAANQSAIGTDRNPTNAFESRHHMVVGVVSAVTEREACETVGASCYNGQVIFATTNLRSVKGLTQAVREYRSDCVQ